MKPVYSNRFYINVNSVNGEVTLDLKHTYIENEELVVGSNNQIEVKPKLNSETVGSFVFAYSDALALRNVLNDLIKDQTKETDKH